MSQGQTRVLDRLLHLHASTADGACARRFGNADGHMIEAVRLLAIPVVEGIDFGSQCLERRELERAVFFRS